MSFFKPFLLLVFVLSLRSSIVDDAKNLISKAQSYDCLNPKDPNFLKICQLTFFPPSTNMTGSLARTGSNDLLFKTTFPNFSVADMSKTYLSPSIQKLVHLFRLDTIALQNSELDIIFGLKNQAVRFTSAISIFALQNVTVDFIAKRTGNWSNSSADLLFSMYLPMSSLPKIFEFFFPVDLSVLNGIFNSDSGFSLVLTNGFDFSPVSEIEPSYLFKLDSWQGQGLGLYANVMLTTGDNKVSKFLRKYLGPDANLMMAMTIDVGMFNAFVGVNDFQITSNLTLKKAGVGVTINRTDSAPNVYLEAQMLLQVKDYVLTFDGKLVFTAVDASMEFTMEGVWVRAFGLDRLAFGNLLLTGGITYEGVPSSFSCGAEVAIGQNCYDVQTFIGDGYCLRAQGYVGVDMTEPKNNFFYFGLSSLTLQTIMRSLFGSSTSTGVDVPAILNNALQFPKGITVAYALNDHSLPNLNIKAGFVFKGEIRIFDAVAALNLEYYIKDFHIKAEMYCSPINLGGVFQLVGNSTSTGPYFFLDAGIKPSPILNVNIAARITVLGISAHVYVYIGKERLYFDIGGPLLGGLLEADLRIELLNENFKNFNFNVMGNIRSNQALFEMIAFVCDKVSGQLNHAKDQINASQSNVDRAIANVEAKKTSVCANIFEKCKQKGACNSFNSVCDKWETRTECDKKEQQCTGGWRDVCSKSVNKCASKLGPFSFLCRAWNWVCVETSKVCNAFSEVCTVTKNVIDYTKCAVKRDVCIAFDWVVDTACQVACKTTQAALDTAILAMKGAYDIMEATEQTFGALARAADKIGHSIATIFNIKSAGFNLQLNAGNKNGFNFGISVNLNMIVLGKEINKSIVWSFGDDASIRQSMVEEVIYRIKNPLAE